MLAAAGTSSAAWAGEIFDFYKITNNGSPDVGAQLTVEVSSAAGGTVDFTFRNNVGVISSITDVYFDDGTLLGIADITHSAGVTFSQGADPGDLPGGNGADPDFEATQGFTADSDGQGGGVKENGVNASDEWLTINFTLKDGQTYNQTLLALADGSLRIGIHVQGFDDGGSDSYVNNAIVPLPGTAAMAGGGLFLAGAIGRRRRD